MNECPGGINRTPWISCCRHVCGIRKIKKDIAMIVSGCAGDGCRVFTLNKTQAAPVLVDKIQLKRSFRVLRNSCE